MKLALGLKCGIIQSKRMGDANKIALVAKINLLGMPGCQHKAGQM